MATRTPLPPPTAERPLDIAEDDWSEALRREALVRPLAGTDSKNRSIVSATAAELGLSAAQVYRLIARFRRNPVTVSLVVAKPGVKRARGYCQGKSNIRLKRRSTLFLCSASARP